MERAAVRPRLIGLIVVAAAVPALMGASMPAVAPMPALAPMPAVAPAVAPVPAAASAAAPLGAWVAAPAAAASSSAPSRILLTPTADPATSQRISWTMPARTKGQKVAYRVPGAPAQRVAATRGPATSVKNSGSAQPRYSAVLAGLTPGTAYEYRIVTSRGSSKWITFTTANLAAPVTMIGLGDTQVDNRGVPRATLRRALADAPGAQLVLHAGDVVDRPYKGTQWADLFAAMGTSARTRNWVVAIGNHEQCVLVLNCRSKGGQAFRSYFDWPDNGFPEQGETWFHVDYQGVRIVVLDSFGGRMAEQAAFLDKALAENPTKWSIVLMHASPFVSRPARTNPPEVLSLWLPIIEQRKVDLVLSGHDHSYARGSRTSNGPVFAVSVSGPKYYEVTDADWVLNKATRTVWAAATSTYQVITITGDTLTYKAVVTHRGKGSTSPFGPGGVLDQFTIVKTGKGEKVVR